MRWLIFFIAACLLLSACAPATSPSRAGSGQAATRVIEGYASWYGPKFAGRPTANGEIFDPSQLTAAHKTLPFGTRVRVTNLTNNRSVTVRINDRGPFVAGRIIDLSRAAAERIAMIRSGVAPVRLELLTGAQGAPSLHTAVDAGLEGYDIASGRHPLGTLLLLMGQAAEPVLVRVVSNRTPQGLDLLVSADLFEHLGDAVRLAEL